ncbi:MAG: hypothetical protein QOD75_867 [Blastocatellia bacterium]|jgi:FkbM family methyltransferase|nr:hypothetical protein [Blastocatellia bacterium]
MRNLPPWEAQAKKCIAAVICHPLVGKLLAFFYADKIPAAGILVDTNNPLVSAKTKAMLFWGLYESAEIRFIQRHLRRDLDVVELGGSIGVVTCQIRKLIASDRKVICVEANPKLIGSIQNNLHLNKLTAGVAILNRAIGYDSAHTQAVPMNFSGDNLGGHISSSSDTDHKVNVERGTLSQILEDNSLDSYVLVSDIEGAEAGIALNDSSALKNCRQIIIELHDAVLDGVAISVDRLFRMFSEVHGFQLRDSYGPVYVFENSNQAG